LNESQPPYSGGFFSISTLLGLEIGFFEPSGTKEQSSFWIPFLYRDALGMVQGAAE